MQWQAIGIFTQDDLGNQRQAGRAFAQRMNGTFGGQDVFVAVVVEHGLFLPVLQHIELGRNVLQLFLDLGEVGFYCALFFVFAQKQLDTLAGRPAASSAARRSGVTARPRAWAT